MEVFAGDAGLTAAVAAAGVRVATPDEFEYGGTDFRRSSDIALLRDRLVSLKTAGFSLVVHFAPPCSTFSRARDRAARTKLRSSSHPEGLPRTLLPSARLKVREANAIARECFLLAAWAHRDLQATVTLENPERSYIWDYLDTLALDLAEHADRTFSQCRYGTPYRKDTRLRVWGSGFEGMDLRCTLADNSFSCGADRATGHGVLGFGGYSTRDAAAYPPGVCSAWARAVAGVEHFLGAPSRVQVTDAGAVHRHKDRGATETSEADRRRAEDLSCNAGMRNPAAVVERWPELGEAMAPVYQALTRFLDAYPAAQQLSLACGKEATKQPPSRALVDTARRFVAVALGLEPAEAELHHSAAPWRHRIVNKVVQASGDPDTHLPGWLEHGAPTGLARQIEPGGLFPPIEPRPTLSLAELEALDRFSSNRPSFNETYDADIAPGVSLMQGYVNAGFGELFADQQEAERKFGCNMFPAPLGNISKRKADGTLKHRVIQDLRANSVNAAAQLPERQVLPRPLDHGRDMADLAASGAALSNLVLDFSDAFMSIPIHQDERRFCCASVPQSLVREREPLTEHEAKSGTFVVWRVLGFGGKPFPLVFSRPASFAARSAQAMFWSTTKGAWRKREARVKIQLYVDDPVITLAHEDLARRHRGADLVLWWWLALGIPLAWSKGRWVPDGRTHEWIGVVFTMQEHTAVLSLPEPYVEELRSLLNPLAVGRGHIKERDILTIVGKCNRVAQVVPEARPFVGAMYAALTGAQAASTAGRREAPPGRLALRRFQTPARWMKQLLRAGVDAVFPLERRILPGGPAVIPISSWTAQFDASPWGGGAVLRRGEVVLEYWYTRWEASSVNHLPVQVGSPASQCFWEFLALLVSLVLWGDKFVHESLQIVGDNVGALSSALSLKGAGPMLAISRELAWRRARRQWKYVVGHIATESNILPDLLSRQHDPKPAAFPSAALAHAVRGTCPDIASLWKV